MRRNNGLGRLTHAHDFVRDLLGLSLTFLEVRSTPIKFGCIDFFIKRGLDTKQFFVRRKLIPTTIGGAGAESYIIAVSTKSYGGRRVGRIRGPSSQLAILSRAGLVTDIGVGLES